jgi:hypothetical protein
MKNASVALAVGAGYLLGRRRKARLAIMLATATAVGGGGGLAKQAFKRGGKLLGSSDALGGLSPEIGKLAGTVRSDLADAGKAAARSALNSRIDSLTESLHDRAESMRGGAEAADEPDRDEPDRQDRTEPGSARIDASRSDRPRADRPRADRPRPPRPRPSDSEKRSGDRRPVRQGSADASASAEHAARPSRSERIQHRSAEVEG